MDEAPDYASDGRPAAEPTTGQRRAFVLALVAVPVVLVVTVLAFAAASHDDDTATDAPDTGHEVVGLAPSDGKDSQRLPVDITPHRDLQDGQVVTISGSGFPPNVEIAFATCTNGAESYGIDSCDLTTSTYLNGRRIVTNPDGTFREPYAVRRHIVVNGVPVDCGRGNIDPDATSSSGPPTTMPGDFTCVIGGGVLSDYDISGGGPVSFAGAEFTAGSNPPPATTPTPPPPGAGAPHAMCPNTTEYDVLTEEHGGTTMTVLVPPTPIYVPC